jgi:hypothetical protein
MKFLETTEFEKLMKTFIETKYPESKVVLHIRLYGREVLPEDTSELATLLKQFPDLIHDSNMISEDDGFLVAVESEEKAREILENFPTYLGNAGLYIDGILVDETFVR